MTGGSKIVASGVPPSTVLYNIIGPGSQVALNGGGGGVNCCRASIDGTMLALERNIALSPGLVNGEVIGGQDISIVGGAAVKCPPCARACPRCGDGVCEGDETSCNCPADCTRGEVCGEMCQLIPISCGDGFCALCTLDGESHESCPEDCPLVCTPPR